MAIKKILVRAPNWIGDAVMCLPSLEELKALYLSSEIFVLAKPRVIPVFESNPAVRGIISLKPERHSGFFGTLRLSKELRGGSFDLAVLFQNAFGAALISFLGAAKERVGYARDMRSGLLTKAIPASGDNEKASGILLPEHNKRTRRQNAGQACASDIYHSPRNGNCTGVP